jgi:hypothetical protein
MNCGPATVAITDEPRVAVRVVASVAAPSAGALASRAKLGVEVVDRPENGMEKSRPVRLLFPDYTQLFLNLRDKNRNG